MVIFSFLAVLALSASGAHGWGASGHQAVGFIAMEFLSPKALSFVQNSLGDMYNRSLGPAATFIGDIGQPLHVEADALGGNRITARCNGASTNLHSVSTMEGVGSVRSSLKALEVPLTDFLPPDSGIINRLLQQSHGNSVANWVNDLVARIKTGSFKSLTSSWLSCSSVTQPLRRDLDLQINEFLGTRAVTPLECPLVWGGESNKFVCSTVFTFTTGEDLCTGSYFTDAVPVIELQIAKQAFRLAAWLNVLFDGATNLP
ncbi:hypothetical protein EYR40_004421 [Pleurotus pulmonarius]|nr:hypothetical protein EYR40_004421 [Pleurotus pulmonarius]KAF4607123.1 hypothetical protein EYR38_001181 [Pleurotus pulmonarius]